MAQQPVPNGRLAWARILVPIVIVLVLQSAFGIWWASSLSTSVEFLKDEISEIKATIGKNMDDQYRGKDAAKDFGHVRGRLDEISIRVGRLENVSHEKMD